MERPTPKTHQDFSVGYAFDQATALGQDLPPGDLVQLNQIEWSDRHFILDQAARFGPVFKVLEWGKFTVCIVGLKECAQFLQDHDDDMTPVTMELKSLFSKGFLRQMGGADHRYYREALVRAISSTTATLPSEALEPVITENLSNYAANQDTSPNLRNTFIESLRTISSGMLIQLFFGARYGSAPFKKLMDSFQRLGPDGLVWRIEKVQEDAYEEIKQQLMDQRVGHRTTRDEWLPQSIIGTLQEQGALDETMIGNLIYMVEMGRFDTYSLFRWITKFAAENPPIVNHLSDVCQKDPTTGKTQTEAFVLETLRLEQIERLGRHVDRDILFGGYLIPKHAYVRLCLWESHKSPKVFPEPFRFNPERFTEKGYTNEQFAPFGLGKHRCPLANFVIHMCTQFLHALVVNYTVEPVDDGPPIRGTYHWEPAWKFAPRLKVKTGERAPS